MKVKICFNHEIHMISKIPDTFAAFVDLLTSKFKSQLPAKWTLQYTDSDGDNILINDEKDYEEFTHPELGASLSAVKVYVVSVDSFRPSQEANKSQIVEKIQEKQEEDYQVIQKEESKPEEVLHKEEEKPVIQEVIVETQEVSQPSTESANEVEVQETVKKVEEKEEEEEKIEKSVQEEVIPAEIKNEKMFVDLDDLAKLISNMIESRLPQVAETIKNQLSFEVRESKLLDDVSMEINPYENAILEKLEKQPILKPLEPQVKHFGISCSGCKMMPIVGIRYRCTVCPRFDFCENCEETCEHAHNFVKMKQRDLLDIFRPNPQVIIQAEPVLPVFYNPVPVENNNVVAEPVQKKKERLSRAQKKEQKQLSRNYFKNLQEMAKKLQKCFPKEDFDILCTYVNGAPEDMTLEELVENFKH